MMLDGRRRKHGNMEKQAKEKSLLAHKENACVSWFVSQPLE